MQFKQKVNTLDVVAPVVDYIDRLISDVQGIKSLVLDEETTGMVSLVYSQTQILKKDVYLIEKIEKPSEQKMQHMKVIYLVRPTQENFTLILSEIKSPRFYEYYIYFVNTVSNYFIEKLAEADETDVVKQVQEVFMDFYCIQPDLFTLNIPSTLPLSKISTLWTQKDLTLLNRVADGVKSLLLSLRRMPSIRFQASSQFASSLASLVCEQMKKEYEGSQSQFIQSNTTLLFYDRREDPMTPLLNQWTYQAMLHELIGIHNNRVDTHQGHHALASTGSNKDPESEFVVSSQNDSFFAENVYANFGELAINIKDFIDRVTKTKNSTMQINSLDDMQKAVDKIPEIRQLSGNLSKHVTLSCEISRLVEERQLLIVSKLEQDIVCNDSRSEHQKGVFDILNNSHVQNYEKLKLVILYAFRYENDDKIGRMKDILREQGLKQNSLNLVNYALDYAGKSKRSGNLFSDKNFLSKAQSKLKQVFKDVPNIYTQHQTYISSILDQLIGGRLKDVLVLSKYKVEYPCLNATTFNVKSNEIILFIVGGATYEEAREIGLINKNNPNVNVILGGTYLHNSRTFLAEISQLAFENKQDVEIVVDRNDQKFHQF